MTDNYLDLTLDEVYDVISQVHVWPASFDKTKKVMFMSSMIEYFIEKEEYEKCATLQRLIDELEDNKQSDRCSGIEPN